MGLRTQTPVVDQFDCGGGFPLVPERRACPRTTDACERAKGNPDEWIVGLISFGGTGKQNARPI